MKSLRRQSCGDLPVPLRRSRFLRRWVGSADGFERISFLRSPARVDVGEIPHIVRGTPDGSARHPLLRLESINRRSLATVFNPEPYMSTLSHWSWSKSLAVVTAGHAVQVERMLFETVRDYCYASGIRDGAVLECLARDSSGVEVQKPDGSRTRVPREYAWFISVAGL